MIDDCVSYELRCIASYAGGVESTTNKFGLVTAVAQHIADDLAANQSITLLSALINTT